MHRIVGKESSSLPPVSVLLSFLVLTGGLVSYFQVTDTQWLIKQWENISSTDNSQYPRVVSESINNMWQKPEGI